MIPPLCSLCHQQTCICPPTGHQPDLNIQTENTIYTHLPNSSLTPEEAWKMARALLKKTITKAHYDTCARSSHLLNYQNNTFTIGTTNDYARDWLETNLTSKLTLIITDICNHPTDIQLRTYP